MKKSGISQIDFIKRLPFILSFAIPVIAMIGIFVIRKIFPFGDNSFLRTDMYHQYAPFFAEFLEKLRTGGDLTWSWNIGLGSNFTALYAYYLASPFNWLVILCPQDFLLEFMTYMIVIKTGLCGLSFAWYLSRHFKTCHISISFFAVFYAMSGYVAAYSWNIMWLDCIILLPLILLGLEQLVNEDKCILYCISLGLAILSNYYIAIMICIFMVIYFVAQILLLPQTITKADGTVTSPSLIKKFLNFSLYSLLAGGFAAFILIPEILALSLTASGNFNFPEKLTSYFPTIDMLARHFVNVNIEIGLDHWPNLFCGVAVLFLLPLYIMNKKIPARKKIVNIAILFMFLQSFALNIPNFIWHGFHFPNSLPCRQSFIYIAVLLTVCFEALHCIRESSIKQIVGSFWGSILFVLLCEKFIDVDDFSFTVYFATAVFLCLYALMLYLYATGKVNPATLAVVVLFIILAESTMNMAFTSVTTTGRSAYLDNLDDYEVLYNKLKEENPDFYRLEKFSRKTKNDAALVGYPSASIFSSTTNANVTRFYKEMGMEGNTNAYCIQGATPLTYALLSIQYMFTTDSNFYDPMYSYISQSGGIYLYRNDYSLPLGFMVPVNLEDVWDYSLGTPADSQNSFSKALGSGNILDAITGSNADGSYSTFLNEAAHIYVYIGNESVKEVSASVGDESKSFTNVKRGYLLDLGYCDAGTHISLSSEDVSTLNAVAYAINEDNFSRLIDTLNAEPLTVDEFTDTSVLGHINVKNSGLLYTSIPYEKGWTIKVDGIETDAEIFADTMLAVPLSAGSHIIELTYRPDGMNPGIAITAVSLLIFLFLALLPVLYKKEWITAKVSAAVGDFLHIPEEYHRTKTVKQSEDKYISENNAGNEAENEISLKPEEKENRNS